MHLSSQGHGRTIPSVVAAKANGLDLEVVETVGGKTPLEINPLGKIPAFVGANGFVLTEAIAIAIYSTFFAPHLNFLFCSCSCLTSLYDDYLLSLSERVSKIITEDLICVDNPPTLIAITFLFLKSVEMHNKGHLFIG